jgi:adenylate kinase family enzyme
VNLDVNSLIRDENERKTAIGLEFLSMVSAGKIIPAEMIVRMLRRIIYSGDGRKKFILTGFPDIIE